MLKSCFGALHPIRTYSPIHPSLFTSNIIVLSPQTIILNLHKDCKIYTCFLSLFAIKCNCEINHECKICNK